MQLDIQNGRFSKFRDRRHGLVSAISAALRPIELVGELVSGVAQETFQPSQNIYCAVMYLVNAAHDVSSTYDAIVELFDQLKVSSANL